MTHVAPPRWSESEFAAQIARATEICKNKRIEEPLELYSDLFDRYRDSVENLLEESVDLQELPPSFGSTSPIRTSATPSATSPHPPVSDDDLHHKPDRNEPSADLSAEYAEG